MNIQQEGRLARLAVWTWPLALEDWLPPLLIVAAAALTWFHELTFVSIDRIGDLGPAALLPAPAALAPVALVVTYALTVTRGRDRPWLAAVVLVTLVVLLYGLTAMIEPEARFGPTWHHIGLIEYTLRYRFLSVDVDFYGGWPGFLTLLAAVAGTAGLDRLVAAANWAPVLFNLLYLVPLSVILSTLTEDRRVRWLALLLFFLGNWVAQDYMAPQAAGYLVYLVLVALALRWFGPAAEPTGRRPALVVVFLGLFAGIVVSHPLTPFFAVASISALAVLRRLRPWWLPVAMVAITAAWFFVNRDYILYHIELVAGDVGNVKGNVDANVGSRITGSWGHLVIVGLRLLTTGAIGALAGVGLLRSWRRGTADLRSAALMVAPLPLLFTQAYGGEMLLRIYLFSLPFTACYAARALFPSAESGHGPWTAVWATVLAVALLPGFLFARYGNERQDYYSPQEIAAARYVDSAVPWGSLVLSEGWFPPMEARQIEGYHFQTLDRPVIAHQDVASIERAMRDAPGGRSYLVITRSQKAYLEMSSGIDPAAVEGLEARVRASPDFATVYENRDAAVFVLRRPGGAGAAGTAP
jgi:hypothetical protein